MSQRRDDCWIRLLQCAPLLFAVRSYLLRLSPLWLSLFPDWGPFWPDWGPFWPDWGPFWPDWEPFWPDWLDCPWDWCLLWIELWPPCGFCWLWLWLLFCAPGAGVDCPFGSCFCTFTGGASSSSSLSSSSSSYSIQSWNQLSTKDLIEMCATIIHNEKWITGFQGSPHHHHHPHHLQLPLTLQQRLKLWQLYSY